MRMGGKTKDTPTARWERAAEEADVATDDTVEGRKRKREEETADVPLALCLFGWLCVGLFDAGEKGQRSLPEEGMDANTGRETKR